MPNSASIKSSFAERLAFSAMLLIALFPIFSVERIVTGDGPCHLYNSKILLDWASGNGAFYKSFLMLNEHIEPNWLTNLLQIPLLKWFSPEAAERIFFGGYIIAFSVGLRKLLLCINPSSGFLGVFGPLFAWNSLLVLGFENNTWSIALWFWAFLFWLKSQASRSPFDLAATAFLALLLYLAHPIGLAFFCFSAFFETLGTGLFRWKTERFRAVLTFFAERAANILMLNLAGLVLLLNFYLRKEWKPETNSVDWKATLEGLFRMKSLVIFDSNEAVLAISVSVILTVLLILAFFQKLKKRAFRASDGYFLLFLASIWVVLNPPTSFTGGLEVGIRLGLMPFLCLLFWLAAQDFSDRIRWLISVAAVFIGIGFLKIRLPIFREASDFAAEIMSCEAKIDDESRLLTLNYDWAGKWADGRDGVIADRIWLFRHPDCYLGTRKKLIVSDNYEANFWYFPTIHRWQTNMFTQTDKDGINFDNRPPRADFLSYARRTGEKPIDYVLLLSYRNEFSEHLFTREIFGQLDSAYQKTHVSQHGRAMLFELKKK